MYVGEFGKVHRYEGGRWCMGLCVFANLPKDDAHIFCTEQQLEGEVIKVIEFIKDIYSKFGFDNVSMKLANQKRI